MPYYIDPHIHMISRVTDDYDRMAKCGCVAIGETAFWAGRADHIQQIFSREGCEFGTA